MIDEWHKERARIAEENPETLHPTSYQDLLDEAEQLQKESEFKFNDVSERTFGFTDNAALMTGSAAAAFKNPSITFPMALGASRATGVIAGALTEAGIAVASEAAVQTRVRSQRKELGRKYDATEGALMVGMAPVAAAGFYVGLRGLVSGGSKASQLLSRSRDLPPEALTPEVKAAQRYLDYKERMEQKTPYFGEGAVELHLERMRRAEVDLYGDVPYLHASTAVGRALVIPRGEDLDIGVKFSSEVPDETPVQFATRVRESSPETFARIDEVDARAPQVDTELAAVSARLDGPRVPETPSTGAGGAQARAQAAISARSERVLPKKAVEPTDIPGKKAALMPHIAAGEKRIELKVAAKEIKEAGGDGKAVKAARKKIFEHEKETGGGVQKKFKTAKAKMRAVEAEEAALKSERQKLKKERSALKRERETLQSKAEYRVRATQRADRRSINTVRYEQAAAKTPSESTARNVAIVRGVTKAVDDLEKLPKEELDKLASEAVPVRETIRDAEVTAPDDAGVVKQIEASEQQALDFMNENLDKKFYVQMDDGSSRQVTAQQFLDDFDDDNKFVRALVDCAKGVV